MSNNPNLYSIFCNYNSITDLDVSNNLNLIYLYCNSNNLTELDVSNNTSLTWLYWDNNDLSSLNVRNGINFAFNDFDARNNPNLTFIDVDDAAWSSANWTQIDTQSYFSENCSTMSTNEVNTSKISVFPKPVNNILNVKLNFEATYKLFNLRGQMLQTGLLLDKNNTLNVSKFANGLYFLRIMTPESVITKRIAIQ